MKAARASVWDLYNGAKQYVVPLFQRPYVWSPDQWEQLWADIREQYLIRTGTSLKKTARFLGSIVVVREYEKNLDKFTVIDGQQRITTISILLAVIRAFARERGISELYGQISDFLRNTPKTGEGQYVIIPTRVDKPSLYHIFDEDYAFEQDSRIVECFDYFWRILDSAPEIDLNILQQVITEDLCVVYIELDEGENPNQVFEALNYRGVPLEESDLIRNFFFASLESPGIAEAEYDQYWKPMEERLFNDQELISRYIRHFLMQTGEIIRPGEVFEAIRERYLNSSPDEIRQLLRDLNRYSDYYRRIWYPEEKIPEEPVFRMIIRSLIRIRLLGPDQICPFLMLCLADNDPVSDSEIRLPDEDLCILLLTCESYLVRRAVCNRSDSGYTQVFSDLCRESCDGGPEPGRVALFFSSLREPHTCPDDDEFDDHLRHSDLYQLGGDNILAWIILQSLEEFFDDQSRRSEQACIPDLFEDGPASRMIDHIMPETVTGWWQEHLGLDYTTVHQDFLHRLGNLTLTLENPAVKSADFETKKAWYGLDSLLLNTSMKSIRIWRRFQIDQRSGILAAFCRKIWPSVPMTPEIPAVAQESSPCMRRGEISKRARPVMVTVHGTAYPVKFWYQVLEQTVQAIFRKEPRKFDRIIREYPSFFSEDPAQYKSVVGGYSYKSRFGRYQVRDMCLQMVLLVGWNEDSWCLTCEYPD